jgi:CDP-diacylglycerol--glycerol-3-phosphate 3-phosphatidyltransferase
VIFALIGFTDFLDGYLARKLNQFSKFGAFMDPVADKITVALCYILITELYHNPWITLAVTIIIGREIAISALREWMAQVGKSQSIAVDSIGKWKTTFQMVAVGALFIQVENFSVIFVWIAYISLFIGTVLTLVSMLHYFYKAWTVWD